MKTQGEIEAAICEGVNRFEQEYMGRGPKEIHAHLFGDCLVIRLQGVLTAAEKQLVKTLPAEKGREAIRGCQLCHDPVGALSPVEGGREGPERWKLSRGVTCRISRFRA